MNYVICIAGTSGAGKTTLTRALARRCGNALIVSFDDYAYLCPPERAAGLASLGRRGCGSRRLGGPEHDSRSIRTSPWKTNTPPRNEACNDAHPIIVVEEPFGRSRPELGRLIDFVAVLDTPLEVALASLLRELRCGEKSERGGLPSHHIKLLEEYLEKGVRDLYVAVQRLAVKRAEN
jgi:hypothetical protein